MSSAAIARHAPLPISTRRQSGLILEAAFAAISLILLGWLFLWFVLYKAKPPQVHALFVRADHLGVLFQEADVRSLVARDDPKLTPISLKASLATLAGQSVSPQLIYVSAPALGVGPEARISSGSPDPQNPTIRELIETVATKARGDVVLALDCAQVGSDRELGIFGNSPYHGLEEALEKIPSAHKLAVILSCRPEETSLIHEGEGRSLFSMALSHVLTQSDDNGPTIGVEDLYERVRNLVANAAIDLNARQVPQLIAVGPASGAKGKGKDPSLQFRIGLLRPSDAKNKGKGGEKPPEKADAKAGETAVAKGKGEGSAEPKPPADPLKAIRDRLFAEWKAYDLLRKGIVKELGQDKKDAEIEKIAPEIAAPLELRRYEAALDRAERLVRQALRDELPSSIQLADQALDSPGAMANQLARALGEYRPNQGKIPFRPVGDAEWPQVTALLKGLAKADDAAAAAGTGEEKAPEPLSKELEAALRNAGSDSAGYFPAIHLELQLPLWATAYTKEFAKFAGKSAAEQFANDSTARLLQEATKARRDAERALAAAEFGGLDWIRAEIEQGDQARREVQDQLFDPALNSRDKGAKLSQELGERIKDFGASYDAAYQLAELERRARLELSRALYDIPGLGDRRIRADRDRAREHDAGTIPGELDAAIQAAGALLVALGEAPKADPRRRIDDRRKQLKDLLGKLGDRRADLEKSLAGIPAEEKLRARPPEQREKLLRDWVANHPSGRWNPSPNPPETVDERSSAFWNEAIGLATLDTALRRHFLAKEDLEAARASKDGSGLATANTSGETEGLLKILGEVGRNADRATAGPRRPPIPAGASAADREGSRTPSIWQVSFRREAEAESLHSKDWIAADPFWKDLLRFHAERLREDYVQVLNFPELGDPSIEPLPNPFRPRFWEDLENEIPASGEPIGVRVEFPRPRSAAPRPGRKAILAVRLEENPPAQQPSFAMKDRGAGDAQPSPSHLVAVALDGDADSPGNPRREFELARRMGVAGARALALSLECRGFFSGLVGVGDEAGRRTVNVKQVEGELYRIALAPSEQYLDSRGYSPEDQAAIKDHFKAQVKGGKYYTWYKQPFHFSVQIARLKMDAPRKVWVRAVVLANGQPPRELEIQRRTDPYPLVLLKEGEPYPITEVESVHQDEIPAKGAKEKLTIEISLYDQVGEKEPIKKASFEVRSVRMKDCLAYKPFLWSCGANGEPYVDGNSKKHDRAFKVEMVRDSNDGNLVPEPIRPEELQIVLSAKFKNQEPQEEPIKRTHFLWPPKNGPADTIVAIGLRDVEEKEARQAVGYKLKKLGYLGSESESDKELHPAPR